MLRCTLTVTQTLKFQRRGVLDSVERSMRAHRAGHPAPKRLTPCALANALLLTGARDSPAHGVRLAP